MRGALVCLCRVVPFRAVDCMQRYFFWRGEAQAGLIFSFETLHVHGTPVWCAMYIFHDSDIFLEQFRSVAAL